jgi:oligosaccharide repeat unit polymerase
MFDVLLILTAILIGSAMLIGYRSTGDALMPMILFGPMLLYVYAYSPAMLLYNGEFDQILLEPTQLEYVALINLIGVGLFCMGCVSHSRAVAGASQRGSVFEQIALDESTRARLFNVACFLGMVALAGFQFKVYNSGGFGQVFSQPKPFLDSPSGYVGEMPMLAYPAIVLLALTLRGRRIRLGHLLLAFVFASPHLIMASLGGRRGPAFLILTTLMVSWYTAKNRRPSIRTVVGMVVMAGLIMLFLVSNRKNIYLGSEKEIDTEAFRNRVVVTESSSGQEFIYASGLILTATYRDQFYWGLRYFSLLFVRPIPKQLWPTKYEDMGLGWMVDQPGTGGFTERDWYEAVGFVPDLGSAGGFVADLFLEFWWYGLIGCYLIGRLYGYCWTRSVHSGQLWTMIYVELLALSVYLPAQSIGAWLFPAVILTGTTWVVWRRIVAPRERRLAIEKTRDWQSVSASL